MSRRLAALRGDLDVFPSPDRARPGLVIQDKNGFSNRQIIVPPLLVRALEVFDGEQTAIDLRAVLARMTGELDNAELAVHLEQTLSECGFLRDAVFERMRDERFAAWRALDRIEFSHAGPGNYPADGAAAKALLGTWFRKAEREVAEPVRAIAAPHASPEAVKDCYVAAYGALAGGLTREAAQEKTFVILGTSHYGELDKLGTTRRPFATPFGVSEVDREMLAELRGPGILEEDYYFSMEHSVEFQVVFLQFLYGPNIRILPLLCGSYALSIYQGGLPESNDEVRRYLDSLQALHAKHGDKLLWILGIDLAHVGRRYGDDKPFQAGEMPEVEVRDRRRLADVAAGRTESFWADVQDGQNALKWCGSAPLYTFLRAVPSARGRLMDYSHWQIDRESVVSVGAMTFRL
jgi:AmmeMemoRadiSam system protein B